MIGAQRLGGPAGRRRRIQPSNGWAALNLGELWEYRDLLRVLAGRDIKLRYRQTALGVVWVVLQPLLASLIFAIIFGRFASLPSDGLPYLLFVYAGLLPWNLFAGSLQRAGSSLVSESGLISKVYFPRLVIPMGSALAVVVDFLVALLVLFGLMAVYGVMPTWNLLTLPLLTLLVLAVSVGVSLLVSAMNVYYRDFMYALPFAIQVWMYASPVVYATSLVPAQWSWVYAINPMVGAIEGFRWAVLGTGTFPGGALLVTAAVGLALLLLGALVFRRVERSFADVI